MAGEGTYLCREAGLAVALLVLPRRRVDVCSAKARSLEDAVELVGGVIVEEEGQPWPDCPH